MLRHDASSDKLRHRPAVSAISLFMLWVAAGTCLFLGAGATVAKATEPCGDFGECKAFIEINSTDGDIGFHFLMDGEDLNSGEIHDPTGTKIFEEQAKGPLREQKLTETFVESAEPLCWADPDADPDELIVTLEEFLERWPTGTYVFSGMGDGGEKSTGEIELTHALPAAPASVAFNGSQIMWDSGSDLGNCASFAELNDLIAGGILLVHPEDVTVAAWDIVLEPDVEDGDPTGNLVFNVRVSGDVLTKVVTVPADYLASLPDDTPVKIEVGAIGVSDNATFTEVGGFCVNEVQGCE
jgi:hypothetical protein